MCCYRFLVNDQLDAQFFSVCLFQFFTCLEQTRVHHQENQLYQYSIWHMSLCVGDSFVCRSNLHTKRSPTQSDVYQMLYWYNWFSWWCARGCSKHVENWNKHIEKNYASSWSFTKNHNKMHGQQNIKLCCYRLGPLCSIFYLTKTVSSSGYTVLHLIDGWLRMTGWKLIRKGSWPISNTPTIAE